MKIDENVGTPGEDSCENLKDILDDSDANETCDICVSSSNLPPPEEFIKIKGINKTNTRLDEICKSFSKAFFDPNNSVQLAEKIFGKYFSYDTSVALCSLLSMAKDGKKTMERTWFPEDDKKILDDLLPPISEKLSNKCFVKLDKANNFSVSSLCKIPGEEDNMNTVTIGNRLISSPPKLEPPRITLNPTEIRKRFQLLAGIPTGTKPSAKHSTKHTLPLNSQERDHKKAGRNAYEIRADVLEMALEWVENHSIPNATTDDVLDVAKKFYQFIENK